jgi:hypothetical protein
MVRMNSRFAALLLFGCLACSAPAWAKTVLPDACGDDKVKFDVFLQSKQPAPDPPEEGKAQIVFVEIESAKGNPFFDPTIRYGMDGTWVGANRLKSYFAISVAPGVHHLCANWQGKKDEVGVSTFTAEAGKVYYFAFQLSFTGGGGGGMAAAPGGHGTTQIAGSRPVESFDFVQLTEDDGKFRVKAYDLSQWKPKD